MASKARVSSLILGAVTAALGLLTACSTSPSASSATTAIDTSASTSTAQTTVTTLTTTDPPPTRSPAPKPSAATNSRINTTNPTNHLGSTFCLTAHLALASEGSGGAGGTDYLSYSLTNTGSHTCTMRGYAGVSIVTSDGTTVQHPALRGQTGTEKPTPVTTVSLAPHGGRAYFLVTSVDVIPSGTDCQHSFHGQQLRVYPPNNTAPLYLKDTSDFCDLGVGAVTSSRNRT